MQSADMLLKAFEKCMVKLVCHCGVDVNKYFFFNLSVSHLANQAEIFLENCGRLIKRPWLAPVLQFVAGLGELKAKSLLSAV